MKMKKPWWYFSARLQLQRNLRGQSLHLVVLLRQLRLHMIASLHAKVTPIHQHYVSWGNWITVFCTWKDVHWLWGHSFIKCEASITSQLYCLSVYCPLFSTSGFQSKALNYSVRSNMWQLPFPVLSFYKNNRLQLVCWTFYAVIMWPAIFQMVI